MTRRGSLTLLAAAVVFLSAFAISARAAEGEQNPANAPIGQVFRWLNFAVVFGGLGYLIARRAPGVFRARAGKISAAMTQAAAAKAEADRQLREAEERLQRLGEEVAGLREAAERDAAAEAERMRRLTREEAEKIQRAARAEVDAAERAARMELKAIAAQLAVERAEALLKTQINAETQDALFHLFVEGLPGRPN